MRRASCFVLATALACATTAFAADPALTGLHDMLTPLRHVAAGDGDDHRGPYNAGTRGGERDATPALTGAKHALRDWIESRLAALPADGDERVLASRLNAALRHADLFCERTAAADDPGRCSFPHEDWNSIGFVYPEIRLDRPAKRVLVVRAGLGILCGTDMSAYAYIWRAGKWRRIWESEQAIGEESWRPQGILAVRVSEPDAAGNRNFLTLGNMDWCQSNFYPIYARLWRAAAASTAPKLLLDLEQGAFLGAEPPAEGRVGLGDVTIRFERPGFDDISHSAILHFRIDGDRLQRISPIAPDPKSFAEEWLHAPWPEAARWSAPSAMDSLREWHEKLQSDEYGASGMPVRGCTGKPARVEVNAEPNASKQQGGLFFLVAAASAEQFEMLGVGTEPHAGCDVDLDR